MEQHTRYRPLVAALACLTIVAGLGCASTPAIVTPTTASAVDTSIAADATPRAQLEAPPEPAQPSPEDVRAQLASRRAQMIDRLHAYAEAGVFPRNVDKVGLARVFVDGDGRRCAVANLIWLDGHDDLVRQTAKADNAVRVAYVDEGPLHDWVLGSGFTREEIDQIQEPDFRYDVRSKAEPIYAPLPPAASPEAQEQARIRAHFVDVEAKLRADSDASLDVAVTRLRAEGGGVMAIAR